MKCPSTQKYHEPSFLWEVWTWHTLATLVFCARWSVRLRTVGWRGLRGDDYFSVLAITCCSCNLAAMTVGYKFGSVLDFSDEEFAEKTACQLDRIRIGTKFQFLAWNSYPALIWSLKAMMLFFFSRLALGSREQKLVKYCAWACGISYVVIFVTVFTSCQPFELNWQSDHSKSRTCVVRIQNYIVTITLNVLTDIAILAIPLPFLWKIKMSIRRKIGLTLLMCSGFFLIAVAILRFVETVIPATTTLSAGLWGTRETIVGILTVNAPIIRPIFTRAFWRRDFDPGRRHSGGPPRRHHIPDVEMNKTVILHDAAAAEPPRRGGDHGPRAWFGFWAKPSSSGKDSTGSMRKTDPDDVPPPVAAAPARLHVWDLPRVMGRSHAQPLLPEPTLVWPLDSRRTITRTTLHSVAEVSQEGGEDVKMRH